MTPAPVTPVVTEPDLGERGRRLYREVLEEHPKLGPRQRVVLEETARTADRCERLDRILRGDLVEWARIETADGGRYHVVVDRTLAEARQQQAALARLLSELRQSLAPPAKESAPARPEKESGGGKVVDLASRLAQLRSTPTG